MLKTSVAHQTFVQRRNGLRRSERNFSDCLEGWLLCEQKGGSVVEEVLKTDHFL